MSVDGQPFVALSGRWATQTSVPHAERVATLPPGRLRAAAAAVAAAAGGAAPGEEQQAASGANAVAPLLVRVRVPSAAAGVRAGEGDVMITGISVNPR